MHRHNIVFAVMLIVVGVAVVATGYAKGWGPLGVLNVTVSRLTKGEDLLPTNKLANETKAPVAPETRSAAAKTVK